ncbi:MAG: GNAT family N-acetyltransferase [Gemmatimonadota bacterium]|nr:GNAT family N-acetyltransferase [Gemmatimonadota bacterium]MDE3129176.1 GNAT family N-acetyltransferase [Gemmatimonadota bacterium]MDE3172900.1 GNAT family N-acetyltransferase [Gemmatimonadota bacterium]MDE3214790.1 GNAT family N-acetyltransferase [Gemmatimonadota bacterium]
MVVTPVDPAAAPAPGTGLRVRPAAAADLDAVVELRLALLREYGHHAVYGRLHPDVEARAPRLCRQQLDSPRDAFFLAEAGGRAVGLLRCTESEASPLLLVERFAYLSSVYVRPGYRRRGILRALLGAADAWCRERGIADMRLHNVPGGGAAAAWAAVGFDVTEEVRIRRRGEP